MGTNTVLFGWSRSNPGREHLSGGHFEEFVKYLNGRKEAKAIDPSLKPLFARAKI